MGNLQTAQNRDNKHAVSYGLPFRTYIRKTIRSPSSLQSTLLISLSLAIRAINVITPSISPAACAVLIFDCNSLI